MIYNNDCLCDTINNVIKIQTFYRKYKIRKLYKKYEILPNEIKNIIKYYIKPIYYDNKILSNLIINKLDNFIFKYCNNKFKYDCLLEIIYSNPKHLILNEIFYLFKLLNKYYTILILNKKMFDKKYNLSAPRSFFNINKSIKDIFDDIRLLILKNKGSYKKIINYSEVNLFNFNLYNIKN